MDRCQSFRRRRWLVVSVVVVSVVDRDELLIFGLRLVVSVVVVLSDADVSAVAAVLRSVAGAAAGCVTVVTVVVVFVPTGTRVIGSEMVGVVDLFSTAPIWVEADVLSAAADDSG